MPAKSIILKPTSFSNFAELYRYLRSAPLRALLSVGQVETIADVIDASLPGDLSLEQRSTKGTTYLYLDGAYFGRVNAAGRYFPPSGTTQPGAPLTASALRRFSRVN